MSSIDKIVDVCLRKMVEGPQTDLDGEVRRYVASASGHGAMMRAKLIDHRGVLDADVLTTQIEDGMRTKGVSGPSATQQARRAASIAAELSPKLHAPGKAGKSRDEELASLTIPTDLRPPVRPLRVAASPFVAQDVWVDGVRLRYVDVGPAHPKATVLLIHGHSSRLEELDQLTDALRDEYRVLVPDLPGCGYSDHPLVHYTVSAYEKTLMGFLDALGVDEFIPAGGSLGGNLTLRLALNHGDRAKRAVSWAPAGWGPTFPLLALADLVNEEMFWLVLKQQAQSWYSDDNPKRDELIEESLAYRKEVLSAGFINAYKNIANDQVSASMKNQAPNIAVPTLLMVGEHDHAIDMFDTVEQLSKTIPNAKLVVTPSKHSVLDEHPQILIAEMKAFLA